MLTEIMPQIVNVNLDSTKLKTENVMLVASDVKLVSEMLISVLNVTETDLQSMTAHVQTDISNSKV